MAKKPSRNQFRDRLADYYLTNRAITKEDDERYKKEQEEGKHKPWSFREKAMLVSTVVALILLLIKYLIF